MHSMTAAAEGLSTLLPGQITLERGTREDYAALAHLHYAPGNPATWAGVWRAVWRDFGLRIVDFGLKQAGNGNGNGNGNGDSDGDGDRSSSNPKSAIQNPKLRTIAVGVLSYPTPAHRVRERVLGLSGPRYGQKLRFINEHVRTISRVIVHPQFRGLGIASQLIRRICEDCPTRYVEAIAAMGEVHPLFEKGGMRKIEGEVGGRAYFIFDREGVLSCQSV
jgi:GNAT superfamily N-acetyltransferase